MDNEVRVDVLQKIAGQNSGGAFFGFSPWAILAGVIFSIIGLIYLKRGKQDVDIPTISAGVALMLFPYFVTNTLYMILTGAAIMGLHYMAQRYW
jgi:branched-subunit amino acid transport protein